MYFEAHVITHIPLILYGGLPLSLSSLGLLTSQEIGFAGIFYTGFFCLIY